MSGARPAWPYRGGELDYPGAVRLQEQLAGRVVKSWTGPAPRTVGGADIAVGSGRARAAIVVQDLGSLETLEVVVAERPLDWPYLPGLLAFREIPALLAAFEKLREVPDVLLVDGHGVAHPRRMGVATHLGVELGRPTVGVAKKRLVGTSREPRDVRGGRAVLRDGRETIGTVLRTRVGVKPVFVSVGHRIDLPRAVRLALRCSRYRLPEPIRAAHRACGSR